MVKKQAAGIFSFPHSKQHRHSVLILQHALQVLLHHLLFLEDKSIARGLQTHTFRSARHQGRSSRWNHWGVWGSFCMRFNSSFLSFFLGTVPNTRGECAEPGQQHTTPTPNATLLHEIVFYPWIVRLGASLHLQSTSLGLGMVERWGSQPRNQLPIHLYKIDSYTFPPGSSSLMNTTIFRKFVRKLQNHVGARPAPKSSFNAVFNTVFNYKRLSSDQVKV